MKRRRTMLAAAVAVSLALAGCGGSASVASGGSAAKGPVSLAVGFPAKSASFTPLFVGVAQGFFKRNGADVKLKLLHGSSSESAALLSNGVQIFIADANPVMAAIAKGTGIRMFGSDINVFSMSLWAEPSMRSVKDLEGHALGLLHVASLADSAARESLPKLGVDLKKVKMEYLGSPATAVAALIAGKVPAVVASAPQVYRAQAKGFHELVNFARFRHVSDAFVTTPRFLRQHPSEITDFLKGYVESAAFIENTANQAAVEKDITRYVGVRGGKILRETYSYFRPIYQCDPMVTAADLADSVQWTLEHSHVKLDPTKFVDTKQLQALEKSGFVKRHCGANG